MVVCERWVGDWTDCNILTPSSSDYSSISFLILLGCSTAGPEGSSPLLRAGSQCLELQLELQLQLTPTYSNCLWHRVISLFEAHLLPESVAFAPNSTRPRSSLYLDIFDRMHLFLDWRLGRRSICYTRKIWFNLKRRLHKKKKRFISISLKLEKTRKTT